MVTCRHQHHTVTCPAVYNSLWSMLLIQFNTLQHRYAILMMTHAGVLSTRRWTRMQAAKASKRPHAQQRASGASWLHAATTTAVHIPNTHYSIPVVSALTACAALEPAWLLQALGQAVELRVVGNCCCRAGRQCRNCVPALNGLPALLVPTGEGPHVGPNAGVVVAEALLLDGLIRVAAAGARVRAAPKQQCCSGKLHSWCVAGSLPGHTARACLHDSACS
jgi:hypothetical protein